MFTVLTVSSRWINRLDQERRRSLLRPAAIVESSIDAMLGKDLNRAIARWRPT
jgi:hypothetical protein